MNGSCHPSYRYTSSENVRISVLHFPRHTSSQKGTALAIFSTKWRNIRSSLEEIIFSSSSVCTCYLMKSQHYPLHLENSPVCVLQQTPLTSSKHCSMLPQSDVLTTAMKSSNVGRPKVTPRTESENIFLPHIPISICSLQLLDSTAALDVQTGFTVGIPTCSCKLPEECTQS